MNEKVINRLTLLRKEMSRRNISACIIPTSDPHMSEYVADCFKFREYFSGFNGSAGTLYVTSDDAYLITDGRYFLQAEDQLTGTGIKLVRSGIQGQPDIFDLCKSTLRAGDTLFADGTLISTQFYSKLKDLAKAKKLRLETLDNPVASAAAEITGQSFKKIRALPFELTGLTARDKLSDIRAEMKKLKADAHIITSLDEIAWILNLRGDDIKNTPVFYSYLFISQSSALLYASPSAAADVMKELTESDVTLRDYVDFYSFLPTITSKRILCDKKGINSAILTLLPKTARIVDSTDPATLRKAVKNDIEIENTKRIHQHDGLALARFMHLIKEAKDGEYTELSATEALRFQRQRCTDYLSDSFDTICAYGLNAAIVHYSASPDTNAVIHRDGALLVDSGGQYNGGTTDITRVFVLGEISDEFKRHYTAVCKSMLKLQSAVFKSNTSFSALDILARESLWKLGLDFRHGTGHGVGHMLSVHEGPNRFYYASSAPLIEPGMITSVEPGLYIDNKHGIRIENETLCTKAFSCEYGDFLKFEPLTVCPIDLDAIIPEMLDREDIDNLNAYHSFVYNSLSCICEKDELSWLKYYTRSI